MQFYRGGGGSLVAALFVWIGFSTQCPGAGDAFLLPDSNILWRTAPCAEFEVPVSLPYGASEATLVVAGYRYRREYTGIADGMFSLSLPPANNGDGENVYDLTLTFNDAAATTQHAKLAVVRGAAVGSVAEAEVRTADTSAWGGVRLKAVMPVPSGVDAVSVDGQPVDAGLWQSPGWFLLPGLVDTTYDVSLSGGGSTVAAATLQGKPVSLCILFK